MQSCRRYDAVIADARPNMLSLSSRYQCGDLQKHDKEAVFVEDAYDPEKYRLISMKPAAISRTSNKATWM